MKNVNFILIPPYFCSKPLGFMDHPLYMPCLMSENILYLTLFEYSLDWKFDKEYISIQQI